VSMGTHCDGPGCDTWTRTMLEGWVQVIELPCASDCKYARHFCSWDCLLRFGAAKEPIEDYAAR
jgi:hypothetical protein